MLFLFSKSSPFTCIRSCRAVGFEPVFQFCCYESGLCLENHLSRVKVSGI